MENNSVLTFKQINDEKRPLAANRINIYAFFGTKDQGKAAILSKKESVEESLALKA